MGVPLTEREIVGRVLEGDAQAFREVVRQYKGLVYHIVNHMIADVADYEDLGQEVFLKVYQSLPSFRFRSTLATWISRITYNACLNHVRYRRSHPRGDRGPFRVSERNESEQAPHEINEVASCNPSPEAVVMKHQAADFVRQSVRTLPAHYRAVIALHYLEEFNLQEVARIVNMPVGTVKSYLFRGRRMLKDRLLLRFRPEDLCP
jgi:RNA polymerase sigma-70 factor (ECF subfamily)